LTCPNSSRVGTAPIDRERAPLDAQASDRPYRSAAERGRRYPDLGESGYDLVDTGEPDHVSVTRIILSGTATQDLDMRADGVDHFCVEDLWLGDRNCGGTPVEGAIRTLEDPL
jgi:hypothetical protein